MKKVVSHESVQEKMARQVVKIKENRDEIADIKEVAKENKSEDTQHLEYDYGCSIGDMLKAKGKKTLIKQED